MYFRYTLGFETNHFFRTSVEHGGHKCGVNPTLVRSKLNTSVEQSRVFHIENELKNSFTHHQTKALREIFRVFLPIVANIKKKYYFCNKNRTSLPHEN